MERRPSARNQQRSRRDDNEKRLFVARGRQVKRKGGYEVEASRPRLSRKPRREDQVRPEGPSSRRWAMRMGKQRLAVET